MTRHFLALIVAALAAVLGLSLAPASAAPVARPSNFYLALGDSLAAGYQPGAGDDRSGGYVGIAKAREVSVVGPTVLINDACSGETTDSMINGGVCDYGRKGSQLNAAVQFLNAHSGQVGLITIDIGANDVDGCIDSSGNIDFACVQQGINKIQQNLPTIYGALRQAAPNAEVVVANYYDPFLAIWLGGTPHDRDVAMSSVSLARSINNIIAGNATNENIQFKVADVFTAFQTKNFKRVESPFGTQPQNVVNICNWTHMCSDSPPDIHANDTGYQVIGNTVAPVITGMGPAQQ